MAKPHGSIDFFIVDRPKGAQPDIKHPCVEHLVINMPKNTNDPNEPEHDLIRLKSFDLKQMPSTYWNGNRLSIDLDNPPIDYNFDAKAGDVTPTQLSNLLPTPFPWMLLPEMNNGFYDWSYNRLEIAMLPFLDLIKEAYVIGYSFPEYDSTVCSLLSYFIKDVDIPKHIVNPSIGVPWKKRINSLLGKCKYHKCGFQEMKWN